MKFPWNANASTLYLFLIRNAKDLYEYDGYDVLLYDTIYTSNYYNAYGNDSENEDEWYSRRNYFL